MRSASLRRLLLTSTSLVTFLLLLPVRAQAQVLRFSGTAAGKIVSAGNTLGLSKANNENGPGTKDSIGAFITLNNASVDNVPSNPLNPWMNGTTSEWAKNGSSAVLTLSSEAQVLYAELVWGGSSSYGTENVTTLLDTPVKLSAGNTSITIAPDPTTSLNIAQVAMAGFPVNYYVRSADVTDFVKNAGGAVYFVEGVPATQTTTINSLNAAGWTLTVVLHDSAEPVRNLSVFVGGSFVDENSMQDYTVNGFCTPTSGAVNGKVSISAIEGDANLVGDQLLIAPTKAGPFKNLSGPNNPQNNFFCSQINGPTGALDTQGSFGFMNHNAATGVNISGGRQGWDVTTVPITSQAGQLQNAQTSAVIRTITTGDSYIPTLAAFAIDVNAPDFTGAGTTFTAGTDPVKIGDKLALTLDLVNKGQVNAQNLILKLPLEPGLSLAQIEMDGQNGDINGNPVSGSGLAAGVNAGALGAGKTRHVVVTVDVVGPPQGAQYLAQADWQYGFQLCAGATLPESYSQFVLVSFDSSGATTSSSGASSSGATTTSASTGSGGAAATTGSGEGGGGAGGAGAGGREMTGSGGEGGGATGTPGDNASCSCSIPGEGERPSAPASLALLAMAGILGSRRRARVKR